MCYTYDTYGKCISHTGTSNVIFGYNGRDGVVTDENGFIYMRARYYSPEMKRFINADVIAGEISNAVTLNRFAYANGNPVSNIDPFGLSTERGNWSDAVDTDDDGTIDYYIYEYTYTTGFFFKKEKKGKVYIYINVSTDFFEEKNNRPDGFNEKTDLMIGDFTNSEDPNMYAYQAQKVKKAYRDEIVDIMLKYDDDFDTKWDRTKDSLIIEWEEHHRYRRIGGASAKNIDFNNGEEGFSRKDYAKKAFKRGWDKIKSLLPF